MSAHILQGERPDGTMHFAAIDEAATYIKPQVCELRFASLLAPFHSEEAAEAALREAGCGIIVQVGKHHG